MADIFRLFLCSLSGNSQIKPFISQLDSLTSRITMIVKITKADKFGTNIQG
jgi:hypothetical protein